MISWMKKKLRNILGVKNIKILLAAERFFKRFNVEISNGDIIKLRKIRKDFPQVLNTKETLDFIIKNNASICRFGDAEFDICNNKNKDDPYQKPSEKLTERLSDIVKTERGDGLLICIPPFNYATNNIKNFHGSLSFWEWYWLSRYEEIKNLIVRNSYGNSFVTRESVFYENELKEIQKIWDGRDVVFVYGGSGRFKVNSIIFNNIKSYKEIVIKPTDAFSDYDEILEKCRFFEKDVLFMVAAGPTATVLSYDLWKEGYQALDVGHLPNSYDEFLGDIISPENIPLINN